MRPFEELFDFFFFGIGQAIDALDRRIMEELEITPEQFQDMLEQIQNLLKEMEGELSELTRALLNGNRGELERLLRDAADQEVGRRLSRQFQVDALHADGRAARSSTACKRDRTLQRHAADARRERRRFVKRYALSGRTDARSQPPPAGTYSTGATKARH